MTTPKSRITITIDAELLARIETVCDARGEPRSAFIERVLSHRIEGEEPRPMAPQGGHER